MLEIDERESQDIKLLEEGADAEDSENYRLNPVESTSNADIETLSSIKLSNDGQDVTSDNPGIVNDEDSGQLACHCSMFIEGFNISSSLFILF